MKLRRAGLVHPTPQAAPSGGDLYDRRILEYARAEGFPLEAVAWGDRALTAVRWDLLVWDSLLLDRVSRRFAGRTILLLHWLPSLDPALDPASRTAAQSIERAAIAQADRIIAAGPFVAAAAMALAPGANVNLCAPGVSRAFRRASAPSPPARRPASACPRLLTVAHLVPAKGYRWLVDALGRVGDLPWHWHVVGDKARDPALSRALCEAAAASGIGSRITWHGALAQAEVAELMRECDLFVFASDFEAYGTVLAEAAAAGLPVLSTRVGAAERLVRHGVTGYLVDVGDRDGFTQRLRGLLLEPRRLAALRDGAPAAQPRGWDVVFREFRSICEAAAASG